MNLKCYMLYTKLGKLRIYNNTTVAKEDNIIMPP